jgi:hypothetical protein
VVGFPDRGDGLVDELPWGRAALGAARQQVPDPAAEVRPAEQRVRAMTTNRIMATAMVSGEGFMDRPARQRMPGARPVVPGARRVKPWPAGPYGTCSASSSAGGSRRHRRDMIIGTPIETTVKIAYRARITPSVTGTPLDGVTASLTSMAR